MNWIVNVYTFFLKLFDSSRYNFVGIYSGDEIHTLKKKIHVGHQAGPCGFNFDLVLILRSSHEYTLLFLLSCRKITKRLHFPKPGHIIEVLTEDGKVIENPYEEGTPFRLAFHKLKLHKRVRRGISMGNECIHEGNSWPVHHEAD